MARRRIAILGGGLGGLATAWELTSYPGWEEELEVTVYQQGWRLGGKAASGRGPCGRVEEVGLHLLLGWYDNAFPLFRDAWDERERRGLAPRSPHRSLEDAIAPNNATLLMERVGDRWESWPLIFPPNRRRPGDGPPLSRWALVERGAAIVLHAWLGSPYAAELSPRVRRLLMRFFPRDGAAQPPLPPPAAPHEAPLAPPPRWLHRPALSAMSRLLRAAERRWGRSLDAHAGRRRLFLLLDLTVALIRGILADVWDPGTQRFHYRRINDQDFRAWLRSHGARERTLRSPVVRFFYTGTYEALVDAEQDGGQLAAGTALQFFLPALAYKGSFCFQLRLGTGDTLIAPLYQVLAARGVRFAFFHQICDIRPDGQGIAEVVVARQVDAPGYEPLVEVCGNPCWPSEPVWERLPPETPRVDYADPQSTPAAPQVTLCRGADFDEVVLAIPPRAHPSACPSLMAARPDWAEMVEGIGQACVLSAQLWFDDSLTELGFEPAAWGMARFGCAPNVVTAANPLFSWLDQSCILPSEDWPDSGRPQTLAMLTGILPRHLDPLDLGVGSPAEADGIARAVTWQWLMDNMGQFLPGARPAAYPSGIDLRRLTSLSGPQASGPERLRAQFFRANLHPSDRYVIALPGTEALRMRPEACGFDNLTLAGDWTDYGVNIGYMEGTVVSAHRAVRAIRERMGHTAHRPLVLDPDVLDRL